MIKRQLFVTLSIFMLARLCLTAQVALPVDGFESVGLAFSVLEHPVNGALYLPSVLHGTLESTDDGRTWKAVDTQSTFDKYQQNNTLLWQDDTTMYARVVDGYGYVSQLISTDLGRTWKKRNLARFGVKSMTTLVDGTCVDEYRFDVSTDYGRVWKRVPASYDTAAYHMSAILVAPRVAAVWDWRGNWWEVDCVNDTAVRHRIKDWQVYGYHLFADGSYIAVAHDSWRWYSKEDSLLRKQTDTVIGGKKIVLGGSKLVTTGKRWTIITRDVKVFDVTTSDIRFIGEPSTGVVRYLLHADVRDGRLVIASRIGTGVDEQFELSEFNPVTMAFRVGVRARADMIGNIEHLSTITRSGTPIVLTDAANILRYNTETGDWANAPVTPLNVAPQPLTVVAAIPSVGSPGFALVTSSMQPYRITAPGEFVVDTTRLPEGNVALRSVGHTLRTTCHRLFATPDFFWLNGYDITGTTRKVRGDTVLCRECHAYLESSAGLTFSGTRQVLRKTPGSAVWDTLTIDPSMPLSKSGYVSDIVESALHNTLVAGLRGYDVDIDGTRRDSVYGGLRWSIDLGATWYPPEPAVSLPYVHSLTKIGSVVYAIASNAVFSPEEVGPDRDVGAMFVDSVAILRSTNGGVSFSQVHLVQLRRALHMHDMRIITHGRRLYTCLQDQRIWVSDDGIRWDEDIDQPLPQGSVLTLTGIGDSIMILATTRGAFILEKTLQVDVETPRWQPLTTLVYNCTEHSITIAPGFGSGQLVVSDLQGRLIEQHTVHADTRQLSLSNYPSGTYTAVFVTQQQQYSLVFGVAR